MNIHTFITYPMYYLVALLENLDENGDGFASQSEIVNFGLVWQGDVDYFDLNCKCTIFKFLLNLKVGL